MRFNGPDFNQEIDGERLSIQHLRIKKLMSDLQWRTLEEISSLTGDPPASVSAQLRHLRKPRFGGYKVEKMNLGGGLFTYRVLHPYPFDFLN